MMVLPRLIYAVATALEAQGPILFSKLDIKDGYWRMVVPEDPISIKKLKQGDGLGHAKGDIGLDI